MAFNEHDVLTALDGALASGAALFSFTEEGHPLRQGLLGVLSGITTARTLVEEMPKEEEPKPEGCGHPADVKVLRFAGHEVYQLCQLCGDMKRTGH